ncbi:glycosyltransferase, partial [Acidobacteriota bacterium]
FNNYKICIAGKFEGDLNYYRDLIQNEEKFEIINEFIPINRVADLFENSDIIALPYISGTQSGVLAIAFGLGKPVVATNVGSISEYLEHGRTGILVQPYDEKSLASAILELLLDEEKCKFYGEKALEFADSALDWKTIGRNTMQVYKDMLEYHYEELL